MRRVSANKNVLSSHLNSVRQMSPHCYHRGAAAPTPSCRQFSSAAVPYFGLLCDSYALVSLCLSWWQL